MKIVRIVFLTLFIFSALISVAQDSNGDFRSLTTGNWNASSSWEEYQSGWSATSNTPSSTDGVITILNTHTITVTAGVTIDQTVVQSGGQIDVALFTTLIIADGSGTDLDVNSGGTFVLLDDAFFSGSTVTINGQLSNAGTITLDNFLSILGFNSGATYLHAQDGSSIPYSSWNVSSNCEITGMTAIAPGQLDQTFGDFTINSSGVGGSFVALGITGSSTIIAGDFNIIEANQRVMIISLTTGVTLLVQGDMNVSGNGRYAIAHSGGNDGTVVVEGNYNYTATVGASYLSTNATGVLNVEGNYAHSSGALQGTSSSTLNFTGTGTQVYTGGGSYVNLVDFVVKSGASLDMGTEYVDGNGKFDIESGGKLISSYSVAGGVIQGVTTGGTIRVSGVQTYAGGSTIELDGGAGQEFGPTFPSDVNVDINNSSGVAMGIGEDLTIGTSRLLDIISGDVAIGSNTLTINGDIDGTGTITGTTNSNLSIGGSGAFTGNLNFVGNLNDLTLNRGASGTLTMGGDLTIDGTFTQTAGSLTFNGQDLTFGDYTYTAGNLTSNSSSNLTITGSGTMADGLPFSGGSQMNNLRLDHTTGLTLNTTLVINGTLALDNGAFTGSGSVTMAGASIITRDAGSISNTVGASGAYNVTYNGSGSPTTGNELTTDVNNLNNLTVSTSGSVTLNKNITVNGALTLSAGTFNAGSQSITLEGNLVSNATATLTSASLIFGGTTVLSGATNPTFGNITVNGSSSFTPNSSFNINGNITNSGTLNSGTGTATFGGTTTVNGSIASSFNNIIIASSSSLTGSSGTMNIAGTFTNNGTFTHNSGTVNFNGTTTFSGTIPDFYGVSIAASSTLTPPATLNIAGNFANSGTFNTTGTTITFNGSTGQEISGGSSTTTFNNLTVNTTGSFNNDDNVDLTGTLALSGSSTLDADGDGTGVFTLVSNASGTARVDDLSSGGNVVGQLAYQRYFDGEDKWRNFGIPVTGGTVADIQNTFTVNAFSLAYYDETESVLGGIDDGWVLQSTGSIDDKGYSMWTWTGEGDVTMPISGVLNVGDQTPTVTYTDTGSSSDDGWNLISNPFASTVDWDLFSSSGLDGTVYVWNAGVYQSWNGSSGNLSNGEISSGQSFWVHANSSPTLTIAESDKVASSGSFLKTTGPDNHLVVTLTQGSNVDKTFIHFRDDASNAFDTEFDGYKLQNDIFNLATTNASDTQDYSINSLPTYDYCASDVTVPLKITNVDPGTYELGFEEIESFEYAVSVVLKDNFLAMEHSVDPMTPIVFDITADAASYGGGRFELVFSPAALESNPEIIVADVCEGAPAYVTLPSPQSGATYKVFAGGLEITAGYVGENQEMQIPILPGELILGLNELTLEISNGICETQSVAIPVFDVLGVEVITNITVEENICAGQTVQILAEGGAIGSVYRWYASENDQDILDENTGLFESSILDQSEDFYVAIVNENGCENIERFLVDVSVANIYNVETTTSEIFVCAGSVTQIDVSGAPLNGGYNIYDESGLLIQSNMFGEPVELNLNNSQNVSITAYNVFGCEGESTIVPFILESLYDATVSSAVDSICSGSSANLEISGAPSNGGYNVYDETGEMIGSFSEGSVVSLQLDQSQVIDVVAYNSLGCEGSVLKVSISVFELDTPIVEYDWSSNIVSTSEIDGATYHWFLNDTQLFFENGPSISDPVEGEYQVIIQVGECTSAISDRGLVSTTTSILDDLNSRISVFPNPATNYVKIEFGTLEEIDDVAVMTLGGQVIKVPSFKLDSAVVIDVQHLSASIYNLRLQLGEYILNRKLVIK